MRPIMRCCVLWLALLTLAGCSWRGWRKAPGSMTAKAPAAPETEVKPRPVIEPPSAVPPPVASPPAGSAVQSPSGLPAEETKENLEAKPARTAALTPATSAVARPSAPRSAKPAPAPTVAALAPVPAPKPAATAAALAPVPAPKPAATAAAAATAVKGCSIAVVGDSLAVGIGVTMGKRIRHYAGASCASLGKVSTGLISKRFFDWEKRLAELVASGKPDAVVVMMGGNDANNAIAGKTAGSPAWEAAYREKAEHFLRIASAAGVKVLWVGLPVMRDPAYAGRVRAVNAAAKQACAAVPGCTYMEAGAPFVDDAGHFVQAKDIGGRLVSLRAKDGVHMTMTGYDLLTRQVLQRLAALGALPQ